MIWPTFAYIHSVTHTLTSWWRVASQTSGKAGCRVIPNKTESRIAGECQDIAEVEITIGDLTIGWWRRAFTADDCNDRAVIEATNLHDQLIMP